MFLVCFQVIIERIAVAIVFFFVGWYPVFVRTDCFLTEVLIVV